jgi:hypothetical protein
MHTELPKAAVASTRRIGRQETLFEQSMGVLAREIRTAMDEREESLRAQREAGLSLRREDARASILVRAALHLDALTLGIVAGRRKIAFRF